LEVGPGVDDDRAIVVDRDGAAMLAGSDDGGFSDPGAPTAMLELETAVEGREQRRLFIARDEPRPLETARPRVGRLRLVRAEHETQLYLAEIDRHHEELGPGPLRVRVDERLVH